MNYSANASKVSSAILKIFFASILLVLILSPVVSAGRQDSTEPQIKRRTIRVDKQETEESAKAKRAEKQQRSQENTAGEEVASSTIPCESILFLGDVESVRLFAFNYPPNTTVTFTTTQTNAGVIGFSATQTGPFVEAIEFPVTMDGSGSGISSPYYVKGLMLGFTSHSVDSPFPDVVTSIDYNVIPHCNCPPIPIIP